MKPNDQTWLPYGFKVQLPTILHLHNWISDAVLFRENVRRLQSSARKYCLDDTAIVDFLSIVDNLKSIRRQQGPILQFASLRAPGKENDHPPQPGYHNWDVVYHTPYTETYYCTGLGFKAVREEGRNSSRLEFHSRSHIKLLFAGNKLDAMLQTLLSDSGCDAENMDNYSLFTAKFENLRLIEQLLKTAGRYATSTNT